MPTLRQIINTLNCIEVKGKDNLDRLLGCIMALEQIDAMPKAETVSMDGTTLRKELSEQFSENNIVDEG